jgi:hypothetical protein
MRAVAQFKCLPSPRWVAENGGWSVFLTGTPVAADASTFDAAIEAIIVVLREYAADWQNRLGRASNHRNDKVLVQAVGLSDDAQLLSCAVGWPVGYGRRSRTSLIH